MENRMDMKELHWAAGFIEGEGSFIRSGRGAQIEVGQAGDTIALTRLVRLFGGNIGTRKPQPNRKPFFAWRVSGARARGVMMTLYRLMTPRRQAAIRARLTEQRKKRKPVATAVPLFYWP